MRSTDSAPVEHERDRASARHYDAGGPSGVLRRGPNGEGPKRFWPVTVLVAAVVVVLLWSLSNSALFHARTIDISGAARLSRADVLHIAGIDGGTNVLWMHTGDLEARLERSRWVADARVSRSLPSTVRIAIRERAAIAELRTEAGFLLVAADGTVLDRSPLDQGLPRLVLDPADPAAHTDVGPIAWVAGAMSPWLRHHVRAVSRTSEGNVVVHLDSGIPAYYGEPTSIVAKGRALAAVLRWAIQGQQDLRFIDVAAPLAPTARLDIDLTPVTVPVPGASATPSPGATPTATPTPSPSASPSPSPKASTSPSPAAATTHTKHTKHDHRSGKHRHSG
ncbi:MAG: cell division protein FtsQ/DivIB [Actinomycetota bacterium]